MYSKKIRIKIYELDPPYFWSEPRLAWKACLKKIKGELELLTDMVMTSIRGGMCQANRWYAKPINKYMKCYDSSTESSYVIY